MRTRYYIAAIFGLLVAIGGAGLAQEPQSTLDLQNALEASGANLHNLSPAEINRIVRGFQIAQVRLNLPFIDLDHLAQLADFLTTFVPVGGLHRRSFETFLRSSVLPTRPTSLQKSEK